jgi:demethylmenaquinone methyltransferase/2-methoxy-6-polyprenyl-1,4-benzoquinol methylase
MHRVTKPGGRIVICEFSKVSNSVLRPLYTFYLKRILPTLSSIGSKTPEAYGYLSESILAWPDQYELGQKITKAGYKDVQFRNLTFGVVAVHRGLKVAAKPAAKPVAKKAAAKPATKPAAKPAAKKTAK